MYLVAVAWLYVVLLMALAEGTAVNGSWLGATVTLSLYGLLPLAIALYLLNTPARRAARRRAEALVLGAPDPDRRSHPPGHPVAAEREEA
ncbi:MAG TPA: hypothetical protein VHM00_16100 [Caldimonas sp.]|jgi:hypothetical protein|nr:hypothetical protein [Caldimonas sp.]HEX2542594.1 hypothetical protein [Caldimonas sp.]